VSRYFMLIPEAVQLVIQAGAMAKGGDVFVLDMGEPVRIVDLARTMIALSGLTEKTAAEPGRRHRDPLRRPVPRRKAARGAADRRRSLPQRPSAHHAHEGKRPAPSVLETFITCLMMACETNERAMIESMVKAIVTEYKPQRCPPFRAPKRPKRKR
jgi:hypothetical protein